MGSSTPSLWHGPGTSCRPAPRGRPLRLGPGALGEAGEAMSRLREGEAPLNGMPWGDTSAARLGLLSAGSRRLLLGWLDEAHAWATALASSPRHPGFVVHALHLLGDIATHPDRFDAESGEAHYRQALRSPSHGACAPSWPTATLASARCMPRLAGRSKLVPNCPQPSALYCPMDMTFWLPQARRRWRR